MLAGMMFVALLAANLLRVEHPIELAVQFSRACGQNCFALSYLTLLEAVRDCCSEASEDTLKWLAAATAAGVRQVQLSVHHGYYEALRWHWAHTEAKWIDHKLVAAGVRPRNALLLLRAARSRTSGTGMKDRDALGWLLSAVPELLLAERVGYVYTRAMQSQSSERARLAGSSGSRRVESFDAALQRWKALEEVRAERWMAMVEGLKAMLGRWEKADEMQRQQAPRLSAYQCFARATRPKLVEEAKAQARADGDGSGPPWSPSWPRRGKSSSSARHRRSSIGR